MYFLKSEHITIFKRIVRLIHEIVSRKSLGEVLFFSAKHDILRDHKAKNDLNLFSFETFFPLMTTLLLSYYMTCFLNFHNNIFSFEELLKKLTESSLQQILSSKNPRVKL